MRPRIRRDLPGSFESHTALPPRVVSGRTQELAGEGEIGVGAGDVGGQALSLGLIDHVAIDIEPVVFGRGKPYFGTLANGLPSDPSRPSRTEREIQDYCRADDDIE